MNDSSTGKVLRVCNFANSNNPDLSMTKVELQLRKDTHREIDRLRVNADDREGEGLI